MHRKQLEFLSSWFNKKKRKPLVIRGARQVGKSTLVEMFARQNQIAICTVNLERYPELKAVFSSKDPQKIIQQIEFLPNIGSLTPGTLLFLDEIQAIPEAIVALRYFYEDMPELAVVGAGSLLEFALRDHSFSMPVGRIQYLHMGPMTFSEFLLAIGEKQLTELILIYEFGQEIGEVAHKRLLNLLRSYYYTGGMPEAVAVFVESRSYKNVSEVHRSIIDTYRDDFPKYAGSRNLNRLLNVFNFAAGNVGVKVKYSNISSQEQSVTLKKDIELLTMARVISKVVHSHCSGLPLQADLQDKVYKLLFLDIGLMNAVCGLDWPAVSEMEEVKLINQGAIAEQFIGQHLQALLSDRANRELTYWLREGRTANAKVDFVIAMRSSIIPVEVKSGASGSLKSLHQFMGTKDASLAFKFDQNLPSVQHIDTVIKENKQRKPVSYNLISLPLYLVERIENVVLKQENNL